MTAARVAMVLSLLALAACGAAESSDLSALRTACNDNSSMSAAQCDCAVDLAADELSKEQISFLATMTDPEAAASAASAEPDDVAAVMSFLGRVDQACPA